MKLLEENIKNIYFKNVLKFKLIYKKCENVILDHKQNKSFNNSVQKNKFDIWF